MSVRSPAELVAEFKKSGEFDRLRRELLHQFRTSDGVNAFTARVNDIVGQKLSSYSNAKFNSMGPDALHAELLSEMNRYPLVQRAVANMPVFSDPSFQSDIRHSLSRILISSRQPNGQPPVSNNRATENEASKLGSDVNDPTRHERSRTPDQKPIISLNGRNIVDQERNERNTQPNGVPAGNNGLANSLSDEERQDAASEDERLPTRRPDIGHGSRPQSNGVVHNGFHHNSNRRESFMDLDR